MFSPSSATLGLAAAIPNCHPRQTVALQIAHQYAKLLPLTTWLDKYLLLLLGNSAGALTGNGGASLLNQGLPRMTTLDAAVLGAAAPR